MAVKKTVFLLLLILFSVIVKTKQPISPEGKFSIQIEYFNDDDYIGYLRY